MSSTVCPSSMASERKPPDHGSYTTFGNISSTAGLPSRAGDDSRPPPASVASWRPSGLHADGRGDRGLAGRFTLSVRGGTTVGHRAERSWCHSRQWSRQGRRRGCAPRSSLGGRGYDRGTGVWSRRDLPGGARGTGAGYRLGWGGREQVSARRAAAGVSLPAAQSDHQWPRVCRRQRRGLRAEWFDDYRSVCGGSRAGGHGGARERPDRQESGWTCADSRMEQRLWRLLTISYE